MRVKLAKPGDWRALAPLFDAYRKFYGQPGDLAGAGEFLRRRLARGESVVLMAMDGRAILGFTQLFPSFTSVGMRRIHILNDLYVDERARGRGVGSLLLERSARFALAKGSARIILETQKSNRTAQRLYARQGYRRENGYLAYALELGRDPSRRTRKRG